MVSGRTKRAAILAAAILAIYQLLHSFDPSNPFNVQIAQSLNITNKEFYSVVSPFRAWFLLPAIVIAGLTYELVGYRASLLLLAVVVFVREGLNSTAVALDAGHDTSSALFKASAALGAFSFSAGFIVNCGMFSLLPTKYYHAASSANSIAMMTGSLVSSFAGQGLVAILPEVGQTMYIGLACSVLCVLLVLVAMCTRVLPPLKNVLSAKEWIKRVWKRTVFYHSSSSVLEWSSFNAVVLAVHTLVKNMWKSLFSDIDPSAGKLNNGLINGITCGAAALTLIILSFLPRATDKIARPVLCIFPIVTSAIFIGMAYASSILTGAILLVVYNASCECALVMSSVMMAKAMSEAEEAKKGHRVVESEDDEVDSTTPLIKGSVNEQDAEEDDGRARRNKLVDFALMFTLNSVISIIVQDLFNLVATQILVLDSREWFIGFAAVSCSLSSCVIASSLIKALCPRA